MKKGRLIAIGVSLAVVVGVFAFVLPRIADYRAVWQTVEDLTWQQGGALLIAVVANLATFAPPLMAALPGIGYWRATVITQASTASTYIAPGGAAVGMGTAFAMHASRMGHETGLWANSYDQRAYASTSAAASIPLSAAPSMKPCQS